MSNKSLMGFPSCSTLIAFGLPTNGGMVILCFYFDLSAWIGGFMYIGFLGVHVELAMGHLFAMCFPALHRKRNRNFLRKLRS